MRIPSFLKASTACFQRIAFERIIRRLDSFGGRNVAKRQPFEAKFLRKGDGVFLRVRDLSVMALTRERSMSFPAESSGMAAADPSVVARNVLRFIVQSPSSLP